jgi:hypothetical protein
MLKLFPGLFDDDDRELPLLVAWEMVVVVAAAAAVLFVELYTEILDGS